MKHTKEEIVAALQVIKDECNCVHGKCRECSFGRAIGTDEMCILADETPMYWHIARPEPAVWRAFE